MSAILQFLKSEEGPTAVEYAVMIALIVGACATSVSLLAGAAGDSFDRSANEISSALGS